MNQQQHDQLRSQFPALAQEVNGHPLVYLDNAATTQKPQAVLDAIVHYYGADNANVHRAAHALSGRATRAFEAARETVARFINAPRSHEVIWTRGTTEAINLVAQSWGMNELKTGDEIILSTLEHHANIVPWQLVAQRTGAVIRVIPLDKRGDLDLAAYHAMLGPRTRLVSVAHVSNALGTVNPVKEMVAAAKAVGALTLIDGAQAVAHLEVDVQAIGCDFYAFSGHKLYGPTGIGVLWGRTELLERMPPWQAGGEMIDRVSFSGTTFNTLPFKFEAGTPHIAGTIGLAAAIDFVMGQDQQWLASHEQTLT
ncbi:MAG: aminotransferase class V-fold PLP-dependent enzyme, partial [Aeromonas veronii]